MDSYPIFCKGAKIPDFGCGAGRDAKYFVDKGFGVDAVDGSKRLYETAKKNTGLPVRRILFSELDSPDAYDGIWACSSILHVPKQQLPDIFRRMVDTLHAEGIIYTSLKYDWRRRNEVRGSFPILQKKLCALFRAVS